MSHKIRLRPAPHNRRVQFEAHGSAYEASYKGYPIGLIFRRVDQKQRRWWQVWQDSHGHEAKGRYRRRGDAKRALLNAVVEFRTRYPDVYGAP